MAVPAYMQKGSQGPAVVLVQAFLAGAKCAPPGLVPDGDYGDYTGEGVRLLQADMGIGVDGHFGPETRAAAEQQFGFYFEVAALHLRGETKFLQPDGAVEMMSSPVPG